METLTMLKDGLEEERARKERHLEALLFVPPVKNFQGKLDLL